MKSKPLSWAFNAALLSIVAVVIWQFAYRDRLLDSRFGNSVQAGSKVVLPDPPWKRAPKTLVLGLSTYSEYCRANANFYRALIDQSESKPFHVLVALRESPGVSKPYLSALGVDRATEVRTVDLPSAGIGAIPTLLIVDNGGTVRRTWTGKLTSAQQEDVYASLGVPAPKIEDAQVPQRQVPEGAGLTIASGQELRELLANPDTIVVDVRERGPFQEAHIDGALDMPMDEVLSRAPHELPKDREILIYCGLQSDRQSQTRDEATNSFCTIVSQVFIWAGFHDYRFITGNLSLLAAQGVHLSGKTSK